MPVFAPNREFSAAQKAHQQAFRQAAAYAKAAKNEPIYLEKAEKTGQAPYNLALRDWFNKPQITALDVTGWNGQAGQPIRIKAIDDVRISRV
jgi:accessory colonization factor AcfC